MTKIQISGERFEAATEWPVDVVSIDFANVEGGPDTVTYSAFDPDGSNPGGSDLPGVVVNQWTDTLIDLDFDGPSTDLFVSRVTLKSVDQLDEVSFDVTPDQATQSDPNQYPLLERVCTPSPNTVRFEGQRFLTATAGAIGYVITRLDRLGGAGGFNDAQQYEIGTTDDDWELIEHSDTVIEMRNPRFTTAQAGGGPFVVTGAAFHTADFTGMYYYEPWGTTFDTPIDGGGDCSTSTVGAGYYPVVESICAVAPDTVRIVGKRFQSAGAGAVGYTILRGVGTIFSGPSAQHEFVDGSPDGYGWSLLDFTDNVIELHNPNFDPGDMVTGVAFHTADTANMYYYEPWGETFSTPVDGSGVCSGASVPYVTSLTSGPDGIVTVSGAGFESASEGEPTYIQFVIPSDGNFPFDNPNVPGVLGQPVVSWSDTEIVVDFGAQYGHPGAFVTPTEITGVQVTNGVYDITYDKSVTIFQSDSGVVTGVTQTNFDEITITGTHFQSNANGDGTRVSVWVNGNREEFYLPASPNYGSTPPGTGFGTIDDTTIQFSNPMFVGATISQVEIRDEPFNWPIAANYDIDPDLVMV